MEANIRSRRWRGAQPPKRILVIRLQALGDTIITLPYLHGLKKQFADTEVHFLTRAEVSPIPRSLRLFDRVFVLNGGRNASFQFLLALLKLPLLMTQSYDAIIDLQNNRISRVVRRALRPHAWCEFDRYSSDSAGSRTLRTIESLWHWKVNPLFRFELKAVSSDATALLSRHGYVEGNALVVLNPAGFCPSRNWPLKNYVAFAERWLEMINPATQFLLLLMPALAGKAALLKEQLGHRCVDLTGKADQVQAFDLISRCEMVISEDSGLMHMAWVQGIPTVALFSSSRKDWSGPQGNWSLCLDSSDLACGPCQSPVCKFGDNRCLTRYSPAWVVERASELRLAKTIV